MAIWNLGSINADIVYSVPHIPVPGETLASTGRSTFLGGKGANMSVAAARAGADVRHIGAVGEDGGWLKARLAGYGVNTDNVATVAEDTAQAIIAVAADGENAIILHPGANHAIPDKAITKALGAAAADDWAITQNEVNGQANALRLARTKGLNVAYAAAPFSVDAVREVLPYLDLLFLNAVEAEQLQAATGMKPGDLPVKDVIVTLGADGARWHSGGAATEFPALRVTPVDTTGAGDTFTGYVIAGLDQGMTMPEAIGLAIKASALMVTRHGAADAIPTLDEARAFSG